MALLWAVIAGCSDDDSSQSSAKNLTAKTNVVFIVLDTVRADHVSVFGDRAKTPHLEALAQTGVSFTRAYSHASMTGPSHASMFTSLLPRDHGVVKNGQVLSPDHVTLAEVLGKTRRTAAFLSLGALRRKFGFNQGFDLYADAFEVGWWKQADEVNAEVLPWLREHADEPFFLWVHYSDAHEPYSPPTGDLPELRVEHNGKLLTTFTADGAPIVLNIDLPAGRQTLHFVRVDPTDTSHAVRLNNFSSKGGARSLGPVYPTLRKGATEMLLPVQIAPGAKSPRLQFRPHVHHTTAAGKRRGYAGEIEYLDSQIGELLAELDKLGLRERTLIVVTGDHGEELGEYSPYFGHVHHLYEQLIHVPLILSFPGHLPAQKRVDAPVRHIDLMPTILELVGETAPSNMRGQSLVPLAEIGERPVVAQTHHEKKSAILYEGYKYVVSTAKGFEKLYALPDEKVNVLAAHKDIAARAKAQLEAVLSGKGVAETRPQNADLTEEEKKALEALGYTQ